MYLSYNHSRKKICRSETKIRNIVKEKSSYVQHPSTKSTEKICATDDFMEVKSMNNSNKEFEDARRDGRSEISFTNYSTEMSIGMNNGERYFPINLYLGKIFKINLFTLKIKNRNKIPIKTTLTMFYAEMLSAVNFTFCLTLIPWPLLYFWGAYYQSPFWRSKYYNIFMSNLEFPLRNILSKVSIGIILGMTVDRFIALKIPLRYKSLCTPKNGKIGLVVIFLISVITQSTAIFWYRTSYIDFIVIKNYLYYNASLNDSIEHWLTLNITTYSKLQGKSLRNHSSILYIHPGNPYINVYSGYLMQGGTKISNMKMFIIIESIREILMVGLPMLFIAVLSYFIVVSHRAYFLNKKRMKELSQTNKNSIINNNNNNSNNKALISKRPIDSNNIKLSPEEYRATLTQISIVIQFFLCEMPQAILNSLYNKYSCSLNDLNCKFRDYIILTNVLDIANTCLTFYIFLVFNDNFRKLVRDLFTQ
ncbi:unnamed protein product [Gordionus sp. m RMFG-2023]